MVRRSADRRITRCGYQILGTRGTTRHGVHAVSVTSRIDRPSQTLASIIGQPGDIASRSIDVAALAAEVGLTPDLLSRRPHQVSDGQLQRACLARSLAQQPKYLICDEATAMLDAATTAALIRLIESRAAETGVGVLLISHDRELLGACCDVVHDLDSISA